MKIAVLTQEIGQLGTATRRYGGIILSLLLREEESRRRNPIESILELLEPVALVGTLGILHFLLGRVHPPYGESLLLFYATGFFPKYLFMYIGVRKLRGSTASPRRRFPIERRLDYVFAHVILKIIDYAILGVLLFGCLYIFVSPQAIPSRPLLLIPALGTSIALGFGWGMFNVLLTQLFWFWSYISAVLNRAAIILSGALFVPEFLPPAGRYLISFYPEVHAIALFRSAFYPQYPTILIDTFYMGSCAIGFILLGLVLERVTRRGESK